MRKMPKSVQEPESSSTDMREVVRHHPTASQHMRSKETKVWRIKGAKVGYLALVNSSLLYLLSTYHVTFARMRQVVVLEHANADLV
jgi:hypothetical protein